MINSIPPPNLNREEFINEIANILGRISLQYDSHYIPHPDDTKEEILEMCGFDPETLAVIEVLYLLDPPDENDQSITTGKKALHMDVLDECIRRNENFPTDMIVSRLNKLIDPDDNN